MDFDFENGCKNEYKDNNKNHAADPEIGFLTKLISKLYGRPMALPLAWQLNLLVKLKIREFINGNASLSIRFTK